MKKRILCIAGALTMMLSLCGCTTTLEVKVNDKGVVTTTGEIMVSDEALDSFGVGEQDKKDLLKEGYKLVTIDGKKYYQFKESEKIDSKNMPEGFDKITKNAFQMDADDAMDMGNEGLSDPELGDMSQYEDMMKEYMDFKINVTLPKKITTTNGKLSKDKKTATWDLFNLNEDSIYAYTSDYVDKASPKIKGVKNNGTYNKTVTVRYEDASVIASATLDGKKIKSGKKVSKAGKHTVTVEDVFGNKSTVKFTIKK